MCANRYRRFQAALAIQSLLPAGCSLFPSQHEEERIFPCALVGSSLLPGDEERGDASRFWHVVGATQPGASLAVAGGTLQMAIATPLAEQTLSIQQTGINGSFSASFHFRELRMPTRGMFLQMAVLAPGGGMAAASLCRDPARDRTVVSAGEKMKTSYGEGYPTDGSAGVFRISYDATSAATGGMFLVSSSPDASGWRAGASALCPYSGPFTLALTIGTIARQASTEPVSAVVDDFRVDNGDPYDDDFATDHLLR